MFRVRYNGLIMNLPKKDKNGINRLSYSQIQTFKRSKAEFVNRYILNKKNKSNPFIDFGYKVGNAIEKNDFFLFSEKESNVLKSVTRLDLFEYFTVLKFENFNMYGYIDTCSFDYKSVIDYKTGGVGKEKKYLNDEYIQLQIYALSIKQMHEVNVENASVEFITRQGNPFRGERLKVSNSSIIKIPVDLSLKSLDRVEIDIIKTAKEIDEFYDKYKNNQLKFRF